MIKKVGLVVLALIAAVLVYAGMRSPDYLVSRGIMISAPAEKIFPLMNNSKAAGSWGPWLSIDPDTKMSYSGPDEGVGSKASWTGGKQMGTGSATIVESIPNSKVGIKLEYTDPMDMQQDSEYLIEPVGDQTKVTWKVMGQNNFIGRVMCLFVNMDAMVGGMFEQGLGNLKRIVESNE